jgi:hypothetical protein
MQVESPGYKSREAKLVKLADKTSKLRAISFSQRRIGRRTYVVAQVRGVSPGLEWQFDDASKNAEESVHHQ